MESSAPPSDQKQTGANWTGSPTSVATSALRAIERSPADSAGRVPGVSIILANDVIDKAGFLDRNFPLEVGGFEHTGPGALVYTPEIGALPPADGMTAAVPEPGTWLLLISGFGFVGYALRKSRANRVLS